MDFSNVKKIKEYAKENNFGRDLLLTKELDAIYERLEKN